MLLTMSAERQEDTAQDDVALAASGDTRAYERLYCAHVPHIYALCLRMTANRAEAEDATQDAFVQAWRKIDSFRGDSRFSSWLHRIADNVVLGRMRSRKREMERMRLVDPETQTATPAEHDMSDLERAISGLPERARQVFVLAGVYGYTHEQVAEALDVAVGTCKAHLHRARQMLAEQLEATT